MPFIVASEMEVGAARAGTRLPERGSAYGISCLPLRSAERSTSSLLVMQRISGRRFFSVIAVYGMSKLFSQRRPLSNARSSQMVSDHCEQLSPMCGCFIKQFCHWISCWPLLFNKIQLTMTENEQMSSRSVSYTNDKVANPPTLVDTVQLNCVN